MWLLSFLYPLLFASACVQCIHVEDANPFFRKDYEFNADTQNFYKIHTITRPWREAKVRCQLEGASLFVADSKQDQEVAAALMKTKPLVSVDAWIGIHDQFSEGDFITIDGVPIDDVYHQWDNNEPNNANNNENCVILNTVAKSNDDNCEKRLPFICKKSRSSLQWNILCDIPDQSYHYQRDLGKCYKLHLKPRTWTDAYGVCAAEQSYLAVINSKAESEHLVKMVADAPKDQIIGNYIKDAVHLGYHNRLDEGFTTIQGVRLEESGYAVWRQGEPNNAGNEKCGSMFWDGTLNDMPCDAPCIFICEHDIAPLSSSFEERRKGNEP